MLILFLLRKLDRLHCGIIVGIENIELYIMLC